MCSFLQCDAIEEALRMPDAPSLDGVDLQFMMMDIEHEQVYGDACLHVYGKTVTGHSVTLTVEGALPYFYVDAPRSDCTQRDANFYKSRLEEMVGEDKYLHVHNNKGMMYRQRKRQDVVYRVDMVQRFNIFFYEPERRTLFKIWTVDPRYVSPLAKLCASAMGYLPEYVYETNWNHLLRSMIDMRLSGCQWIQVSSEHYEKPRHSERFRTHYVFTCAMAHVQVLHDRIDKAPLRVLAMDTEWAMLRAFDVTSGPVIQIANHIYELYDDGTDKLVECNLLNLRSCDPISNVRVIEYEHERDIQRDVYDYLRREFESIARYRKDEYWNEREGFVLKEYDEMRWSDEDVQEICILLAYRRMILCGHIDVFLGYNSVNFDMCFLLERAKFLGVYALFANLSRRVGHIAVTKMKDGNSKQNDHKRVNIALIPGMIQMDMLGVMQSDHRFRAYGLNEMSSMFLDDQKEDMPYSLIIPLFNGTGLDRRRIGTYCVKDALLPYQLMRHLDKLNGRIEKVRINVIPLQWDFYRGQTPSVEAGIKMFSDLSNYVWPTVEQGHSEGSFKGATVKDPLSGYYRVPIATLDFAGLYPSIMRAHNLCYTTTITAAQAKEMSPDDYTLTPAGYYFVKPHVRVGILPALLTKLTNARSLEKQRVKTAETPARRSVHDLRQLNFKLTSNSVYGFTGNEYGKLLRKAISESVTSYGRALIEQCTVMAEQLCTVANGWPGDAKVIYGDTDSVMVNFGVTTVAEAMTLATRLESIYNDTFLKPIAMEAEKVYMPYLLDKKKRYAGVMYEDFNNPSKVSKIDVKGIKTVRRDNALLTAETQKTLLKYVLQMDPEAGFQFVRDTRAKVLRGDMDLSKFIITKTFKKEEMVGPHVHVVKKMRQRKHPNVPVLGSRVPYIIVTGPAKAKVSECAEDPMYVLENNIPIDYDWYLQGEFREAVETISVPILGKRKSDALFVDPPGTKRVKHTPSKKSGGIMAFVKTVPTCAQCRTTLPPISGSSSSSSSSSQQLSLPPTRGFRFDMQHQVCRAIRGTFHTPLLCHSCQDERVRDMMASLVHDRTLLQHETWRYWTHCQRCQNDCYNTLQCGAMGCPIFVRRTESKRRLDRTQESITRLSLCNDW